MHLVGCDLRQHSGRAEIGQDETEPRVRGPSATGSWRPAKAATANPTASHGATRRNATGRAGRALEARAAHEAFGERCSGRTVTANWNAVRTAAVAASTTIGAGCGTGSTGPRRARHETTLALPRLPLVIRTAEIRLLRKNDEPFQIDGVMIMNGRTARTPRPQSPEPDRLLQPFGVAKSRRLPQTGSTDVPRPTNGEPQDGPVPWQAAQSGSMLQTAV
jgi:hypothetical protein